MSHTSTLMHLLVGSSITYKGEELIRQKDWEQITSDFNGLKSFWGKAAYLYYLKMMPDKSSLQEAGYRLHRRTKTLEHSAYQRYIHPHYSELQRRDLIKDNSRLVVSLQELFIQHYKDFIPLARLIYAAGDKDILNGLGVSFTRAEIEKIKTPY